jgi:DNA-binding MarR family transcriptional regulator
LTFLFRCYTMRGMKTTNDYELQSFIEQFQRISTEINDMHKGLIRLDDIGSLPLGEIHLIECIGKHPEANVTDLAAVLGNTKGAVSQMAGKLIRKGLLVKTRRDNNEKETILKLTEDGRRVFDAHEKLHADLYREIADAMNELDGRSIDECSRILSVIEKYLGEYRRKYR